MQQGRRTHRKVARTRRAPQRHYRGPSNGAGCQVIQQKGLRQDLCIYGEPGLFEQTPLEARPLCRNSWHPNGTETNCEKSRAKWQTRQRETEKMQYLTVRTWHEGAGTTRRKGKLGNDTRKQRSRTTRNVARTRRTPQWYYRGPIGAGCKGVRLMGLCRDDMYREPVAHMTSSLQDKARPIRRADLHPQGGADDENGETNVQRERGKGERRGGGNPRTQWERKPENAKGAETRGRGGSGRPRTQQGKGAVAQRTVVSTTAPSVRSVTARTTIAETSKSKQRANDYLGEKQNEITNAN